MMGFKRVAVLFGLAFFCFAAFSPSMAAAQTCKRNSTDVTLRAYSTKTRFFRNFSVSDLTLSQGGHGARGAILGMAGGEMGTRLDIEYHVDALPNGKLCVNVTEVNAKFYIKPVLFVASDYKKGTCEYREVLKHEKKHIATLRQFHREYTPKYRAELNRIIKSIPVGREMTPYHIEQEQDRIIGYIREKMAAYDAKIGEVLARRQGNIDTPYEYKYVAAQCRKW